MLVRINRRQRGRSIACGKNLFCFLISAPVGNSHWNGLWIGDSFARPLNYISIRTKLYFQHSFWRMFDHCHWNTESRMVEIFGDVLSNQVRQRPALDDSSFFVANSPLSAPSGFNNLGPTPDQAQGHQLTEEYHRNITRISTETSN